MQKQAGVSELIDVATISLGEHAHAAGGPVLGKAGGGRLDMHLVLFAR